MARTSRNLKLLFHVVFITLLSYVIIQKPNLKERPVKKIERFMGDIKHLLLWTKFSGIYYEGQTQFIHDKCLYINCYLTRNRSLLGDLRYFDVLLFDAESLDRSTWDLPSRRSEVQKYIFAGNVSAEDYTVCSSVYDGFFNWTWSYKLNSLLPYTYINVYNLKHEELGIDLNWEKNMSEVNDLLKSRLQSKSKAAAIFMDNCKNKAIVNRLQKELIKYNLKIDVYGKCGTFRSGRKNMNSFYYKIKTAYYFYLSIEDSIDSDYITTKILTAYKNNAVPIVYSGSGYERILPPDSYLDAKKLSWSRLAKKMHDIIVNKEKYYDMFRWRNHYTVMETKGMDFCTLCEILNNPAWLEARISLLPFRKWWNENYETRCQKGET